MNIKSSEIWDVAIVGAGPAGSVCAHLLARDGHRVILIDRAEFPREKACGDFLIGDSLQMLEKLGMREEVDRRAKHTPAFSVFYDGDKHFELSGQFTTLSRSVFDKFLLSHAIESGAVFRKAKAESITATQRGELPTIITSDHGSISAGYAVVATGADSNFTRRTLKLNDSRANAFAFRKYVESETQLDRVFIVYHESIQPGYAWLIPIESTGGQYRYNLGAGWPISGVSKSRDINEVINQSFSAIPEARQLIATAVSASKWMGAPMKCGITLDYCLPSERVVAVGETIGTTYHFTGEGIGKAMLSGLYAANAIDKALQHRDPSRLCVYRSDMERLEPLYDSYANVEKWLTTPRAAKFLLNRLRKSQYLRGIVTRIFLEDASPAPLLKPATILSSFWR